VTANTLRTCTYRGVGTTKYHTASRACQKSLAPLGSGVVGFIPTLSKAALYYSTTQIHDFFPHFVVISVALGLPSTRSPNYELDDF
jgi:hypothetical protein